MSKPTITPTDEAQTSAAQESVDEPQSDWHLIFSSLQEEVLTPVAIEVSTEVPAGMKIPRIDIVFLRRKSPRWTRQQLARLPDGIRQVNASHIICEFKYTQSVNRSALIQALMYDELYRKSRKLKRRQVATFVISARTPRPAVLQEFGFEKTNLNGVYQSQQSILSEITLLVLNELSNEPHNAFFKCFASQQKSHELTFDLLEAMMVDKWSKELSEILLGLRSHFQVQEGATMKEIVVTPEYIKRLGREVQRSILAMTPSEQRLAGLTPEQRMAGLNPEQRLAGLDPEQRLAGLDPEQRLAGLDPEQLLAHLDPAVIEAYLKQHQTVDQPKTRHRKATTQRKK